MKWFSKKGDFTIHDKGISETGTVSLGGIRQSILIQAEDLNNPILLFLHGGPGMPIPGVSCRSKDYVLATTTKQLVKHYIVVYWDQRGTGKSYLADIPKSSMNISQFVSDATELTEYLKKRFQQEKIFLAGYSWGSILGLRLVHENPQNYHAYIGISQIVNWAENDRLCYEWALSEAEKRNDQKAIKALTDVGPPPYVKDFKQFGVLRNWLLKYRSMIYTDATESPPRMSDGFKLILQSPDYTLKNVYDILINGMKLSYTQEMIIDLANIDFVKTCPAIQVPSFFFHGVHDVHVHASLLIEYFNQLTAPTGKHLYWLDHSSHMLHVNDAKQVEKILITEIRNIAKKIGAE